MELPFRLRFFQKLDYYQRLINFDHRLKGNNNKNQGIISKDKSKIDKVVWDTWALEKKILLWADGCHMHHETPIYPYQFVGMKKQYSKPCMKVMEGLYKKTDSLPRQSKKNLESDVSFFLKITIEKIKNSGNIPQHDKEDTRYESDSQNYPLQVLESLIKNEYQFKYEIEREGEERDNLSIKDSKGKIFDASSFFEELGVFLLDAYITPWESAILGPKQALGNLISKGFARYVNLDKRVEDGVIITAEGLLMGEVITQSQKLTEVYKDDEVFHNIFKTQRYLKENDKNIFKQTIWVFGLLMVLAIILYFSKEIGGLVYPLTKNESINNIINIIFNDTVLFILKIIIIGFVVGLLSWFVIVVARILRK